MFGCSGLGVSCRISDLKIVALTDTLHGVSVSPTLSTVQVIEGLEFGAYGFG